MLNELTNARPYAKALFSLALETKQFSAWTGVLDALSQIVASYKKPLKPVFFDGVFTDFPHAENLVRLLFERKKINLLPQIAFAFKQKVHEYEKVIDAEVIAAQDLTPAQKEKMLLMLQKRYQRKILLNCKVDPRLLGGAIVSVGDQVIDGSIKGKLQRLATTLQS